MTGFLRSASGNFTIISAVSMIPAFAVFGLGIDYAFASQAQYDAQSAADAAVLAAASASDANMAERRKIAEKVFRVYLYQNDLGSVLNTDLRTENRGDLAEYSYSAKLKYETYLARVFGKTGLLFDVAATAQVSQPDYDVAMVLDSTGSMPNDNKMDELKKAANLFTSDFSSDGTMRIAVAPFGAPGGLDDATPGDTGNPATQITCQQGQAVAARTASAAGSCASPGLTPDMSEVRSAIDKLEPSGGANIATGIQWGMEALSADDPPGAPNRARRNRLMIVLAGGLKTESRGTTDSSAIDRRTRLACDTAKAAGIEIMTIRLIDGNRTLLRSCASSPDNYFEVYDARELSTIFRKIAGGIRSVRLKG